LSVRQFNTGELVFKTILGPKKGIPKGSIKVRIGSEAPDSRKWEVMSLKKYRSLEPKLTERTSRAKA